MKQLGNAFSALFDGMLQTSKNRILEISPEAWAAGSTRLCAGGRQLRR
jgi:hypothetical protein